MLIGGAELIDSLEPLWLTMFDHHLSIGAAGLPVVDRATSWIRRRQLYEAILGKPAAFVVLARRAQEPVGYVVAHTRVGADDTWTTGPLIGEVESIAVSPSERGNGLGTRLLDIAESQFAALGIGDVMLSVVVGNSDAMRFYERRGMTPVMTTYLGLGSSAARSLSTE